MAVPDGSGGWRPRVYRRAGKGKKSPRILVKCGCCESALEIYYDEEGMEINGVNASREEWKEILLPLLVAKGKQDCR